jgi:hypothetical protein
VAGLFDGGGNGLHVLAAHAPQFHLVPREGGGSHEGAGLDAVRDHGVLHAFQFLDTLDDDAAGARTGDLRAHGVEEIREVQHFRLGGGGFDHGFTFGEAGGHHHVVRAEHGGTVGAAQVDLRAAQAILGG